MRSDNIGMFWQDLPAERGANKVARVMPHIPDTGWTPPTEFPNLSQAKVLAIDTETYDPDLLTKGPGWARGVGHLVGVSIGTEDGRRWYFPMRHEIEPEMNWNPDVVIAWLKDTLSNPKQSKIGANIMYDIGWLAQEGVIVKGPLYDVQYAEALLNETSPVNLEHLAQKYLEEGKESNLLYQWCSDYYGGEPNEKQRKNIYRSPPRIAGPYAESDADLPLRLLTLQWDLLHREGLFDLFKMECELIPLYIAMRFAGVSVNIGYADELQAKLLEQQNEVQQRLDLAAGFKVNVDSRDHLARLFDDLGLGYGKTKKGNPSFKKEFLEALDHPIGEVIRDIRKYSKLRGTFVEGYILDSHINGKVYAQFHPLRKDDGGTRSGRYSSSNPNLQNIPIRDKILGPMIRSLFIPDAGHPYWRKYDYSQIEYRFLVHFAIGAGAEEARAQFNANPDLDYHAFAQELVKLKTGMHIERKPIKNINFGLIYGMGLDALAAMLGITKAKAKPLMAAYFDAVPFAKETMDACIKEADETGIITTISGRRSRFDMWEPSSWADKRPALPYHLAIQNYANIQRAKTFKALNRRLQGSAAELMKRAMHQCWVDGIFDATGVPRLTVHDELDFSDPGGRDEAFEEMKNIMENAIPLSIPVLADYEIGPDWGHVKDAA